MPMINFRSDLWQRNGTGNNLANAVTCRQGIYEISNSQAKKSEGLTGTGKQFGNNENKYCSVFLWDADAGSQAGAKMRTTSASQNNHRWEHRTDKGGAYRRDLLSVWMIMPSYEWQFRSQFTCDLHYELESTTYTSEDRISWQSIFNRRQWKRCWLTLMIINDHYQLCPRQATDKKEGQKARLLMQY